MNDNSIARFQQGNIPSSPKGRKRIEAVLEAASNVLVTEGGENFSMNKVAIKAGLRLSHVQYYFPKKSDLIKAMLGKMMDDDLAEIEKITKNSDHAAEKRLLALINSNIASGYKIEDVNFIIYLWSASLSDPELNTIMDEWYTAYRQLITQILGEINPKLKKTKREHLAAIIIGFIEGDSVITGAGRPKHRELKGLHREFCNTILTLVKNNSG